MAGIMDFPSCLYYNYSQRMKTIKYVHESNILTRR